MAGLKIKKALEEYNEAHKKITLKDLGRIVYPELENPSSKISQLIKGSGKFYADDIRKICRALLTEPNKLF